MKDARKVKNRLIRTESRSDWQNYVAHVSTTIKMATKIVDPYLEHIFKAVLRYGHPDQFKLARTIALPKDGMETYNNPKSYRPITLMSCLGNLVEKHMDNRVKAIVIEYNLLFWRTNVIHWTAHLVGLTMYLQPNL